MPLTPRQWAEIDKAHPNYRKVDSLFNKKLAPNDWNEVVKRVQGRLIKEYTAPFVCDGWLQVVTGILHWCRRERRGQKAPPNSCSVVFTHEGEKWIPNRLLFHLAHRQLGLVPPEPQQGHITANDELQRFTKILKDAKTLAEQFAEPLRLPKEVLDKYAAADAPCFNPEDLVSALKKSKPASFSRKSGVAHSLIHACDFIVEHIGSGGRDPGGVVLYNLLCKAFHAGWHYHELTVVSDDDMMRQNKHGQAMRGGQGDQNIKDLVTKYKDFHGVLPTTKQLIQAGMVQVNDQGKLLVESGEGGKPYFVPERVFDERRLRVIRRHFPDLLKRGRPKGS